MHLERRRGEELRPGKGLNLAKLRHPVFRAASWGSHVLLAVAVLALAYTSIRELSVRRYLEGDSDARLAWCADTRPRIPRFPLPEHMIRAGLAFSSTPEIKQ